MINLLWYTLTCSVRCTISNIVNIFHSVFVTKFFQLLLLVCSSVFFKKIYDLIMELYGHVLPLYCNVMENVPGTFLLKYVIIGRGTRAIFSVTSIWFIIRNIQRYFCILQCAVRTWNMLKIYFIVYYYAIGKRSYYIIDFVPMKKL